MGSACEPTVNGGTSRCNRLCYYARESGLSIRRSDCENAHQTSFRRCPARRFDFVEPNQTVLSASSIHSVSNRHTWGIFNLLVRVTNRMKGFTGCLSFPFPAPPRWASAFCQTFSAAARTLVLIQVVLGATRLSDRAFLVGSVIKATCFRFQTGLGCPWAMGSLRFLSALSAQAINKP